MHFRLVIASLACFACLLVTTATAPGQWPPRSRSFQFADTAIYFPLAVGNSWSYAVEGRFASGTVAVQVTEAAEVEGRQYFVLEGYTPQPALVRLTSQGRLVELRRASGTEHLWYDFAAAEGTIWTSELPHRCLGEAKLASRRSEVEPPTGPINNGLVIGYGPTNCADAGIQEEAFAPGIGLVRRTELTIAGPRLLVLTMMIVLPCPCSRSKRSRSSLLVTLSRFPVGSSASRIEGPLTSALAMATRCRSPPESSFGLWSMRSTRSTSSKA